MVGLEAGPRGHSQLHLRALEGSFHGVCPHQKAIWHPVGVGKRGTSLRSCIKAVGLGLDDPRGFSSGYSMIP